MNTAPSTLRSSANSFPIITVLGWSSFARCKCSTSASAMRSRGVAISSHPSHPSHLRSKSSNCSLLFSPLSTHSPLDFASLPCRASTYTIDAAYSAFASMSRIQFTLCIILIHAGHLIPLGCTSLHVGAGYSWVVQGAFTSVPDESM